MFRVCHAFGASDVFTLVSKYCTVVFGKESENQHGPLVCLVCGGYIHFRKRCPRAAAAANRPAQTKDREATGRAGAMTRHCPKSAASTTARLCGGSESEAEGHQDAEAAQASDGDISLLIAGIQVRYAR